MQSLSTSPTSSTRQLHLAIDGMTCGHCVAAVSDALEALAGVDVEHVAIGSASVSLDPQVTPPEVVIAALEDAGYGASLATRPAPQTVGTTCCSPRSA